MIIHIYLHILHDLGSFTKGFIHKRGIDMNWMDSGDHREVKQRQNKLENRKIEFRRVKVDYNISLAELLVLLAEKAGYDARIEKTNDSTNVEILVPYLVDSVDDSIKIEIYKWRYYISFDIEIEMPQDIEVECNLLNYLNGLNNNTGTKATVYCHSDIYYIRIEEASDRVSTLDRRTKRLELLLNQRDAILDDDDSMNDKMKSLIAKIDVYYDQDIDFNLSGGWNASEGAEIAYMVDSINTLIRRVQKERENLLNFVKNR